MSGDQPTSPERIGYFARHHCDLRFPIEAGHEEGFRPAQLAAAHAVSAHFFARSEPALVTMPTGSGKTAVMALCAFLLRAQRVLAVTPSRLVRDQIRNAFREQDLLRGIGALGPDIPKPHVCSVDGLLATAEAWEHLRTSDVVVGTTFSISPEVARVDTPPPDLFDLLLVDEAHHSPAPTWKALVRSFPDARVVMLTATPFRRDRREIDARLVFSYDIGRARDDGVFGRLEFVPVETGDADLDARHLALAKCAEAALREDHKANLDHRIMVRTSTQARAQQLQKLYDSETNLRLKLIKSSHSMKHVLGIIKQVRAGELDGVICVDMLGEGFDLPQLKIAALHSPHKSLAVTLQFIGRFARTKGERLGKARFLAVPSEIEVEATRLYVPGAEWDELVEHATANRLEKERETRAVLSEFQRTPIAGDDPILLGALRPGFHIGVFRVRGEVDLSAALNLPWNASILEDSIREQPPARILVTKESRPCTWYSEHTLIDVTYDLVVLFWSEKDRLLCVSSTRRTPSVYSTIANCVVDGRALRVAPDQLNRVLALLQNPKFFSVGLKNRSAFGSDEAYRMMTGRAADRALSKRDGRVYSRGHAFGSGGHDDGHRTLGVSSGSKIWSSTRDQIPALLDWCAELTYQITHGGSAATGSGLDFVMPGEGLTEIPSDLVVADWPDEVYEYGNYVIKTPVLPARQLLDVALHVERPAPNYLQVRLCGFGSGEEPRYMFDLDGEQWRAANEIAERILVTNSEDGEGTSLEEFFNEHPPAIYTSALHRIEGSVLFRSVDPEPFDDELIDQIDWADQNVDPLREKPTPGQKSLSLFEWMEGYLRGLGAELVLLDDGAGEMADYLAFYSDGAATRVDLFHCKAASSHPIPGKRVEDVYEVAGQAVKSIRWTHPERLLKQIRHRLSSTAGSKIMIGDLALIEDLLAPGRQVQFKVTIVQPGIGRGSSMAVQEVLASASSYLISAGHGPLRVMGSC